MKQNELHHGGDLNWAAENFAFEGDEWLDLSTGINPVAYPIPVIAPAVYQRLPDQELIATTLQAARLYYDAPSTENLALAPGSQALIQWLPRLRAHSRVAIVGPTYQEHAYCWRQAGHQVFEVQSLSEAVVEQPDVVVVVHPNNPTGAVHNAGDLLRLAETLAAKGGWLVVDEAFADIQPDVSLTPHAKKAGLIILKSFGKFFGLAGLRLGVMIADEDTCEAFRGAIGPWAVPGPTLSVATAAFQDNNWIREARCRLRTDAERLDGLLKPAGCRILGGTSLFRLVAHDQSKALLQHLGDQGILVRPFPYEKRWLRFGLPGRESDWKRLEDCLKSFQNR